MRTIFDTLTLEQLRTRTSEKWRHYPADVLPLFVAEMDVPQAEPVIRAVHDAMVRGDTGYPNGHGLAEAMAGFAATRWDWAVPVERSRLAADVMVGVVEVVRLLTGPGDAVVISPPVYPPFTTFLQHAGRHIVHAPLGVDRRLDLDALDYAFGRASLHGRRAAYLLCNPHNPTGTLHTADELAAVGALSVKHGVRVVADEIHAPLVPTPDAQFVPTTTVIPDAIALHSASKAFNLAALRAAVAVPGPEATDLEDWPDPVADGVMHLGVMAQTAAYTDGGAFLDEVLAGLHHNGKLLQRLLEPVMVWEPPQSTYFAWLDLRAFGDDPARSLLKDGRLAVNPGATFGVEGAGHVRLNFATSTAILTDAVSRLTTVLGGAGHGHVPGPQRGPGPERGPDVSGARPG
ncbi:MalY/PatB family protein [Cellulomonas sp. URHE0023]|uniref:MalY/PatB family protein n=1 Tax=Cellulomonas sp. URHE0023 TaxID=1380354 RepID=UPI000A8212CB|nr:aminotransferase class I/II-fold pyridoxal phosphate-dependent enzyme [Cellulomonas sp. URHE0023]